MARNCDFTMKNLTLQLEKSLAIVTANTYAGIIEKVRKKEDCFWEEDIQEDI